MQSDDGAAQSIIHDSTVSAVGHDHVGAWLCSGAPFAPRYPSHSAHSQCLCGAHYRTKKHDLFASVCQLPVAHSSSSLLGVWRLSDVFEGTESKVDWRNIRRNLARYVEIELGPDLYRSRSCPSTHPLNSSTNKHTINGPIAQNG
ncbi:hypothetical protein PpBr36_00394 [Pyricularia pennisetigena]|uniref:hypothetical protein n=1 Tax=Pyricularia pennisetigena TaxID=1578925 RepID=UPI00114E710E|nr:hypothetical protein PpBr36_00394 [Pyricularia pennisetigena]TLS29568.1 hypothetical protein PpBr36_00394 [Pyricularia pennisetigena]